MLTSNELARISELGRIAGAIDRAQAGECPYDHANPDQRYAWLAGFSKGRAETLKPAEEILQSSMQAWVGEGRLTPFGSKIIFHHGANTIAVNYLGETRVFGPFPDEDAAHVAAAEAIAAWR